jgi:hypothetical protein
MSRKLLIACAYLLTLFLLLGTLSNASHVVKSQHRASLLRVQVVDVAKSQHATTTSSTTTTTAPLVSAYVIAQWQTVTVCENAGSWIPQGSAYPDGLGVNAANWYAEGGGALDPTDQVLTAERLVDSLVGKVIQGHVVYPGFVPDQDGCDGSW